MSHPVKKKRKKKKRKKKKRSSSKCAARPARLSAAAAAPPRPETLLHQAQVRYAKAPPVPKTRPITYGLHLEKDAPCLEQFASMEGG
jgi:hypothetical protein